jgi:hypothetical protein
MFFFPILDLQLEAHRAKERERVRAYREKQTVEEKSQERKKARERMQKLRAKRSSPVTHSPKLIQRAKHRIKNTIPKNIERTKTFVEKHIDPQLKELEEDLDRRKEEYKKPSLFRREEAKQIERDEIEAVKDDIIQLKNDRKELQECVAADNLCSSGWSGTTATAILRNMAEKCHWFSITTENLAITKWKIRALRTQVKAAKSQNAAYVNVQLKRKSILTLY